MIPAYDAEWQATVLAFAGVCLLLSLCLLIFLVWWLTK